MIDEGLLTDLLDLMIIGDLNFSAGLKSFINHTVKQSKSIWAVTMWVWWGSMKDEKLYTQFWVSRSGFLVTLIFDFLALGGSLAPTGCAISLKYVPKIQKFNNLSKTASFVEIFQRQPEKFCLVTPKNVKNGIFWPFFQLKCDTSLRSC